MKYLKISLLTLLLAIFASSAVYAEKLDWDELPPSTALDMATPIDPNAKFIPATTNELTNQAIPASCTLFYFSFTDYAFTLGSTTTSSHSRSVPNCSENHQ